MTIGGKRFDDAYVYIMSCLHIYDMFPSPYVRCITCSNSSYFVSTKGE